jgi:Domain of unknown function (DUF4380)
MSRLGCLLILFALLLSACDKPHDKLQIPQFVSRQADNFILNNGRATLTVSPAKGGRVIGLQLDGVEFLATETKRNDPINSFGSVLWSSPQSEWSWPPLAEHNFNAYSVGCNNDKTAIILTSEIEPKTGYQFVKSYSIGEHPNTFKMRYKIINHSDKTKSVAAIENTRVNPTGLAFFPKGDTEPSSGIFYPLEIQTINGIVWHKFEPSKIRQDHHKVMMDGKEGWLAYSRGQYLFIKRFPDSQPNETPETERQIEIFGHSNRTFAELKHQSALHHLKPGESFEWDVEWEVKKLADNLDVQLGSQDLVDAARAAH